MGRFLLLTGIGSLVWNAGLIGVGMALAARWAEVAAVAAPATMDELAVAAVALPVAWLWRRTRTPRAVAL
jgi:membrane protein DedA with SNARE-associated domain